eukprot:scaffold12430_cov21-Tisochrysis_lutea.AAC.1
MGPVDALALSSSHGASNVNMLAICAGTCVHVVELLTLKHVYRCVPGRVAADFRLARHVRMCAIGTCACG